MKVRAKITAVGGYVPDRILDNHQLAKMVDTSDEWIRERTGVLERHILEDGKGSSDMAVEAVNVVLQKRGIDPMDIELLICATVTPDMLFPATANIITDRIGAKRAWSFDMEAACSSFLYALAVGSQFIETGRYTKIMVVGVDKMSAILDYQDRNTCIIFGDGAGAVLLEPDTEGNGIVDFVLFSDGDGAKHLHMKSGGSLRPPTKDTVLNREHFVYQEGQAVFKRAIAGMADAAVTILEKNALKAEDIAYLVPHQANLRIIDATANRMGLPPERVMVNIQKYGNTTSATLPLCLHDWESKLHKGDNIILASFGGGFTWGAMYLKWGYDPSH